MRDSLGEKRCKHLDIPLDSLGRGISAAHLSRRLTMALPIVVYDWEVVR